MKTKSRFPRAAAGLMIAAACAMSAVRAADAEMKASQRQASGNITASDRRAAADSQAPGQAAAAENQWNNTPQPLVNSMSVSAMDLQRILPSPLEGPIAGLVDARYLTKAKLDARVNMMLMLREQRATWEDAKEKERTRNELAEGILQDWAKLTLLAVHAQTEGFRVSPQRMNEALEQIYAAERRSSDGSVATAQKALTGLGIPHEELAGYVQDAILAEDFVSARVTRAVTESDRKSIYDMQPEKFVIPPRAHLYYLCMRLTGKENLSQKRDLKSQMDDWRKRAAKAGKKGKFLELAKEFHDPKIGQSGGDFGWAGIEALPRTVERSGSELAIGPDPVLVQKVFALKDGQVSEVLACEFGYYVFQMVEHKEAEGVDYQTAREGVDSAMFEQMKLVVLGEITPRHIVYLNEGGIEVEKLREALVRTPEQTAAEWEARRKKQEEGAKLFQEVLRKRREMEKQEKKAAVLKDPVKIPSASLKILSGEAQTRPSIKP